MKRTFLATALVAYSVAAFGQVQSARGTGTPRVTSTPKAAHNSMTNGTTPFKCDQYRNHPHPGMYGFCQSMENTILADEARRAGRPGPSQSVVELPALGTPEAKQLGYACIGGQAFKRSANGWEQVHAREGGWQRCRGG